MNSFEKGKTKLFLGAIIVLGVFAIGFWTGEQQVICEVCPAQDINFSLFWEAYHQLRSSFVDKSKFNEKEIVYGAISGMISSLEDPYTVFFPPEDAKRFIENVRGVFEGVGMEIGIRKNQLQVISPLEGTPAKEAGFRAGDMIIKVDDVLTSDLTIDEAVDLIRGPRGTEVVLTIYRDDWKETKDIAVIRGVIEIPSLKWEILQSTNDQGQSVDIAYLKLYQFSGKAGVDFNNAALEILNSPAKKLILDLRNNPGGYLEIAQDIAGWFLEKGQTVVIEDFGNGERRDYQAEGNGKLLDYTVVVLINEGSASGSEILAGALRDNRGILLIGEKSFGKGSVQEVQNLTGGSSLKITVAKWLTPSGQLITEVGLEPDIVVEITAEDYDEKVDPQLDKAIEVIKDL